MDEVLGTHNRFEGSFSAPGVSKGGLCLVGCTISTWDLIFGRDRIASSVAGAPAPRSRNRKSCDPHHSQNAGEVLILELPGSATRPRVGFRQPAAHRDNPMIMPIKRYRPELHYMRGPGPKWLEKHSEFEVDAVRDDHRSGRLLTGFFLRLARTLAQLRGTRPHSYPMWPRNAKRRFHKLRNSRQ